MRLGVHANVFKDGLSDAPRVINPGRVLHPDTDNVGVSGHRGAKVIQFLVPKREPKPRQKPLRTGPPPPLQPLGWEASDVLEDTVVERPLNLLGQKRDGAPTPTILLNDPGRRCFAAHWPKVLTPEYARIVFDRLYSCSPWSELTNKRGQVARYTCWYIRKGCSCSYTYGTARVVADRKPSAEFRSIIEELAAHIFTKLWPWMPKEYWPNAANLNLYTDISQSVGWHADDESLFQGQKYDCPIVSVSLGAKREFWLALKQKYVPSHCANSDNVPDAPLIDSVGMEPHAPLRDPVGMEPHRKSIIETDLCDGDVMTMEGLCQKYCVHFVPHDMRYATPSLADASESFVPHPELLETRINVTFRWIREHKQRCKLFHAGLGSLFCEASISALDNSLPHPTERHASLDWASNRFVTWKSCQGCDHDGWKGGRNCVKYKGFFLCRRCWSRVREVGDSILSELPTDPEAAAERKRLRILRLRGEPDSTPSISNAQGSEFYYRQGFHETANGGFASSYHSGYPSENTSPLDSLAFSESQYTNAYNGSYTCSDQYSGSHCGGYGYDVASDQMYYDTIGAMGSNGAFTYYQ